MNNSPAIWNGIWSKKRGIVFQLLRNSLTAEILRRLTRKEGRILEAGCGESFILAKMKDSVGIDFSGIACRLSREKGVLVVKGDIHHLPFKEGVFDIVFSQSVLQAEEQPTKTVEEMIRLIRPGGEIAFTVPRKFSVFHLLSVLEHLLPLWPHVRQRYWNEKELYQVFGSLIRTETLWYGQLFWVSFTPTAGKKTLRSSKGSQKTYSQTKK